MEIENALFLLLSLVFALYFLRGAINWNLLNKLEKDNPPILKFSIPVNPVLMFRHLTISFLKVWWQGDEQRKKKQFSNVVSLLLYTTIASFIIVFIVAYKL